MILNEFINEKGELSGPDIKLPEGVLARVRYPICFFDKLNENHRRYSKAVWERVLANKSLTDLIERRGLFGHAEHPQQTQSSLDLTSHVIHKMWMDESSVYNELDVLDTPTGRIVDVLLRANCQVGVSTRAEGDLKEDVDELGGKCYDIIPGSYKYKTTDFTADPSTPGALPLEIRRNLVNAINKESNEAGNRPEERKFARLLLESINCGHPDKCENCGRCEALKKDGDKIEEEANKVKLNEKVRVAESKADESLISVQATPTAGAVVVTGDVKSVQIDPTSAGSVVGAGQTVDVTIHTEEVLQPPEVEPVPAPASDSVKD